MSGVVVYECHITVRRTLVLGQRHEQEMFAGRHGWKMSAIDGDPVLGPGICVYFTRHARQAPELFAAMRRMSTTLRGIGAEVIREKIEEIVYDTKTGVDSLGLAGDDGDQVTEQPLGDPDE